MGPHSSFGYHRQLCQLTMAARQGVSTSSRKRKWNSANVTRINLNIDDDDDDNNNNNNNENNHISTIVVQQATRDGRRVDRTFYPVPIPCDPPTTAESYDYIPPNDEMDFNLGVEDEDLLNEASDADDPNYVRPDSLACLS